MFNRIKIFIICVLIPCSFSHASIEHLRELRESLKNEYPSFVESRYEYFLNHYFSQRVDEIRIMTQIILEKSQVSLEELNTARLALEHRDGSITSADILQVHNDTAHLKSLDAEFERNKSYLNRIEKTVSRECSAERLEKFHKDHSPIRLYSIPVHSITYNEPPKVNTTVYFQGSYQLETGNSNFENAGISSGLNQDQQQISVAGGFVVAGVACAFTAGAACEPTTFSIISAISTAVIGAVFTAFNTSAYVSERNAYIDNIKKLYEEVNSIIQKSNRSIQDKSWSRLTEVCEGFIHSEQEVNVLGYMSQVQSKFKERRSLFLELKNKFEDEAQNYLDRYAQQGQDHFLFYEHLASEFEHAILLQMQALFELIRSRQHQAQITFMTEALPVLNKFKKAKESSDTTIEKKLESAHQLWNQVLMRQALYAPSEIGFDGGLVEAQNKMLEQELKRKGL